MINRKNSFIVAALILSTAHLVPQLVNAQIDTDNRWIVRDFYNNVYPFGTDATMDWTGVYDTYSLTEKGNTDAGSVSDPWLDATLMRVNFYRHMAGLQPNITFLPALNSACQESALIISHRQELDHEPQPIDSIFWTQAGHDAAYYGNIAYGSVGIDAIDGYMVDQGGNNKKVGHRRWILYPQAEVMGSGDVPGTPGFTENNFWPANTLWVAPDYMVNEEPWDPRIPTPRDDFVAWPSPGYVPANLVWSRWSFCYPNADFGSATVTMTGPTVAIPVTLDYQTTGAEVNYAPESSIVWFPDFMNTDEREEWPAPANDEEITVTISGVTVDSQPIGPFQYIVTIFDANVPGGAEHHSAVMHPGSIFVFEPTDFTVTSRSWADGVRGRTFKVVAPDIFDAENGIGSFHEQTTGDYSTIVNDRPGNTTNAFHLTHTSTDPQILTVADTFLVGDNSPQLEFLSSLSWATESQYGSVDIKVGDGYEWKSIWTTSGPKDYEPSFQQVSPIDLSEWSGLTIQIRFRYQYSGSGDYFGQANSDVGWAFDDVTFTDVTRLIDVNELPAESIAGTITTTFTEATPVFIQARDIAFTEMDPSGFGLDWGPALSVTPSADSFSLSGTPMGVWTEHPTVGWIHGETSEWIYSIAIGWINVDQGAWLYTGIGWTKYISGNLNSGLWLYSPDEGFIYLQRSQPGRFLRSPFTGEPATWGSFHP